MAEINAVKKKAYSVLKQYKHRNLSLEDLVHLADENGFTVLDYSKTSEESDTETIIKELGLSSFAKTGNSFVYKNKDIKLIFLKANKYCASMREENRTARKTVQSVRSRIETSVIRLLKRVNSSKLLSSISELCLHHLLIWMLGMAWLQLIVQIKSSTTQLKHLIERFLSIPNMVMPCLGRPLLSEILGKKMRQ